MVRRHAGDRVIGFCLAAGVGSRLAPLTSVIPKPLLAPAGRPLIDLAVEALREAGAVRVVVNAHHGADQLAAHLADRPDVDVVREPQLLGTGGGLANAARLGLLGAGDDLVLVTCADKLLDPADLAALAGSLDRSGAPMVVGLVPADKDAFGLRMEGGPADGDGSPAAAGRVVRDPAGPWDSAGVYALRAGVLEGLDPVPSTLAGTVLGPLLDRGSLAGLPLRGPWADAGTLHRLLVASAGLLAGRWPYPLPAGRLVRGPSPLPAGRLVRGPGRGGPVLVVEGAVVDRAAVVAGPAVLDAGSRVAAGAVVTRAVVGPGATVGAGARVIGSVVGPQALVAAGETVVAALLPGTPAHLAPGQAEVTARSPRTGSVEVR